VQFKSKELSAFYSQLSRQVHMGVPIQNALAMSFATCPPSMKRTVEEMLRIVNGGAPLSEGLRAEHHLFPEIDHHTVQICEITGTLDDGLYALAEYHLKRSIARDKIIGASLYPFFLIVAGIFLCRIPDLILWMFNKGSFGPISYLVDTIGFLCSLLLSWCLVIWLFKAGFKIPGLNVKLDKMIRLIPTFGAFQMDFTLCRWVDSTRLLLIAGYGEVQALDISTDLIASPMIAHAYSLARPLVKNPVSVSEAFKKTGLFRPVLVEHWAQGEKTGQLDEELEKLSTHFEEAWKQNFDYLTAWIPRFLYGVIFLVLSIQFFKLAGDFIRIRG
jgi:general secretion pathway protein F